MRFIRFAHTFTNQGAIRVRITLQFFIGIRLVASDKVSRKDAVYIKKDAEHWESDSSYDDSQPVECLGMTFPNDSARREYSKKQTFSKHAKRLLLSYFTAISWGSIALQRLSRRCKNLSDRPLNRPNGDVAALITTAPA